jgi:hypothetical protein
MATTAAGNRTDRHGNGEEQHYQNPHPSHWQSPLSERPVAAAQVVIRFSLVALSAPTSPEFTMSRSTAIFSTGASGPRPRIASNRQFPATEKSSSASISKPEPDVSRRTSLPLGSFPLRPPSAHPSVLSPGWFVLPQAPAPPCPANSWQSDLLSRVPRCLPMRLMGAPAQKLLCRPHRAPSARRSMCSLLPSKPPSARPLNGFHRGSSGVPEGRPRGGPFFLREAEEGVSRKTRFLAHFIRKAPPEKQPR